jgi:hypothetical protein
MGSFSQRAGYATPRAGFQLEGMDSRLRNRIWDTLCETLLDDLPLGPGGVGSRRHCSDDCRRLVEALWQDYLGQTLDTLRWHRWGCFAQIREAFFEAKWFEVYDLLEFVAGHVGCTSLSARRFRQQLATVLAAERSGYHLTGDTITVVVDAGQLTDCRLGETRRRITRGADEREPPVSRSAPGGSDPPVRGSYNLSISHTSGDSHMANEQRNTTPRPPQGTPPQTPSPTAATPRGTEPQSFRKSAGPDPAPRTPRGE